MTCFGIVCVLQIGLRTCHLMITNRLTVCRPCFSLKVLGLLKDVSFPISCMESYVYCSTGAGGLSLQCSLLQYGRRTCELPVYCIQLQYEGADPWVTALLQCGGVPIGYHSIAVCCNTESCMWITKPFHSISNRVAAPGTPVSCSTPAVPQGRIG